MTSPIHIFTAGRHTDMHGRAIEFTEADLAATAAAYDPSLHEAPIVVGHPRTDDPAYGWVRKLAARGPDLEAWPAQVEPGFAEMVRAGRYKKISASFFLPDSPNNPRPGVYYLRHVGFLGAAPPAVKGLKPVAFAADADGVVELEFGDLMDQIEVSLWRQLREWIIGKFGREDADAAVPGTDVELLQQEAARPEMKAENQDQGEGKAAAGFAEHQEEHMSSNDQAAAAREEELQRKAAEFAERERRIAEAEARLARAECAEFVEGLVNAGRVLPAQRDFLIEFMAGLDDQEIEFGEGDAHARKPRLAAFREFLAALPRAVDFAERGAPEKDGADATVAAPAGYAVDPTNLELHKQALAYMAAHDTDYITAVRAVSK